MCDQEGHFSTLSIPLYSIAKMEDSMQCLSIMSWAIIFHFRGACPTEIVMPLTITNLMEI